MPIHFNNKERQRGTEIKLKQKRDRPTFQRYNQFFGLNNFDANARQGDTESKTINMSL